MNNQEVPNNYNQNGDPVTNSIGTGTPVVPANTQVVNTQTVNQVPVYQTPIGQHYNGNYSNNTSGGRNVVRTLVIIIAISLAVIVGVLLVVTLKKESEVEVNPNRTGTRTLMIYMVASDLESKAGAATLDVNEIKNSGVNLDDVNVIIYAGGTKQWHNDFQNNGIYKLTNNGFELVHQDTDRSMAEPETLTYFLSYVKENYPTDLYDLILWDHGGGPIYGYGIDEAHSSLIKTSLLSIEDLKNAIAASPFGKEKLEFIGFDACLMATVEVASELRNYAYYMIASQESEPGHGWDYQFLNTVNRNTDTLTIGKTIVDNYVDYYEKLSSSYSRGFGTITLSMIELGKVEKINNQLNGLFDDLEITLNQGGYSNLVNQITRAQAFGVTTQASYDLLDLYGILQQLENNSPDKVNSVKSAIEEAVVYNRSNVSTAYGLSIYYPYSSTSTKNLPNFLAIYSKFDISKSYQRFLNTYSKTLSGDRLFDYDLTKVKPSITNNGETLSATLDSSILEHYHSSNYVIFRDMKDGYYMPVFRSSDTTLKEDGTLIANFAKKQTVVTDASGEDGWVSMYEYSHTDEYVLYEVPAILMKKMDVKSVMLRVKVDKGSNTGTIIDVIANDSDGLPSGREDIKLSDWSEIQFFNSKYKILDQNGNYTSKWESGDTYYLSVVSTNEKYQIEFQELDKEYDYYCLFMIQDTQGNIHTTNLIKVN